MSTKDRYAVFGHPIKHSKSPLIHREFARQCDEALQYRAVLVSKDEFSQAARAFFEEGGKGLNITLPFKHEAFDFADMLSDRARRAGAVNTLWVADDGKIMGDNTDGVGMVRDMVANLGWRITGVDVLILGAGGAVRGVLEPLLKERPASVLVVNRTEQRAHDLVADFETLGPISAGGYGDLKGRQFGLVINATSAGLAGEMPDLPSSLLNDRGCCYDMVYGNEPTVFSRWAAHHAAWAVADGVGMLVEQAAESFYLWRGVRPATQEIIHQLREGELR